MNGKELLKRCRDTLQTLIECDDDPCQDLMRQVAEIDDYLAQPDEPVAWALFSKELMPTGAAYAIKRVEIQLAQIEADLGIQDAEIKPLYTSPPDQSARIAELKDELLAVWDKYESTGAELCAVKQQLAALQAKRESLSDEGIIGITELFTDDRNFDYYIDFAREIEAAHGITGDNK